MARRKDVVLGALLTALVAFGAISTDMYLPAMPSIGVYFGAEPGLVQLTLSVFFAGFALAQLAYGPLSDRYGRRPVMLGGLVVYFLGCGACALAQSIEQLIAGRFLMSLGACAGPVLGRAVVRDIFGQERAAKALAYMGMIMGLVPAVAPILGGYITANFGWRGNFIFLTVFATLCLISTALLLRETNQWRNPEATRIRRMAAIYWELLHNRTFLAYALALTFGFTALTAFVSNSSFVLVRAMGVPVEEFGYYFSAVVIGYMIGTFISTRLSGPLGLARTAILGASLMAAGAAVAVTLAFAGLNTPSAVVFPAAAMLIGIGLLFPNALAGAIGPFFDRAGSASALLGFIQMSMGAVMSLVSGLFFDGTARAMTVGMALGAALSLILLLVLLDRRPAATEPAPSTAP
jgi:DHA1 family bicyclomycin/chloramphenicol resistance-like MFS transporter